MNYLSLGSVSLWLLFKLFLIHWLKNIPQWACVWNVFPLVLFPEDCRRWGQSCRLCLCRSDEAVSPGSEVTSAGIPEVMLRHTHDSGDSERTSEMSSTPQWSTPLRLDSLDYFRPDRICQHTDTHAETHTHTHTYKQTHKEMLSDAYLRQACSGWFCMPTVNFELCKSMKLPVFVSNLSLWLQQQRLDTLTCLVPWLWSVCVSVCVWGVCVIDVCLCVCVCSRLKTVCEVWRHYWCNLALSRDGPVYRHGTHGSGRVFIRCFEAPTHCLWCSPTSTYSNQLEVTGSIPGPTPDCRVASQPMRCLSCYLWPLGSRRSVWLRYQANGESSEECVGIKDQRSITAP